MESFSTTRRSGLPWAANLATLAVVVVTTWWSGAQRPAQEPMAQTEQAVRPGEGTLPTGQQPTTATQQQPAAEPQPLRVKADLTDTTVAQAALGGSLPAATVRTVGFKPATH